MARVKFTPTEQRMLAVLADGLPHTRQELHACLVDDMGPLSNIQMHLSSIRRMLRGQGEDVVCELKGKIYYRHVKLLNGNGHSV